MNTETCYVCGGMNCDSMDHVVPVSFFLPPLPRDIVTLPAHTRCHNALDEEYFRQFAVPMAAEMNATARRLYETKVGRAAARSTPLRMALFSALRPSIDVLSPGGIWLGKTRGVRVDAVRFYKTPEKIIRGLFRHHLAQTIAADASFKWLIVNFEPTGALLDLFQATRSGLEYPGVFDSRIGVVSDSPPVLTAWWMRFWGGMVLACFVDDKSQAEGAPSDLG